MSTEPMTTPPSRVVKTIVIGSHSRVMDLGLTEHQAMDFDDIEANFKKLLEELNIKWDTIKIEVKKYDE